MLPPQGQVVYACKVFFCLSIQGFVWPKHIFQAKINAGRGVTIYMYLKYYQNDTDSIYIYIYIYIYTSGIYPVLLGQCQHKHCRSLSNFGPVA